MDLSITRRTTLGASAAGLLGLGAAGLTGCRGSQGGAGTGAQSDHQFAAETSGALATMGFNPSDEVGQARADHAAAQLAGVTITMDTTNFDTQKLTAQIAAGSVPDIIQIDRSGVASFAANGLILPLDQGFEVHRVAPAQTYYEAVLNDVQYEQKIFAVPQFFQPSAIIINRRVTDALGLAPDDFDTSDPEAFLGLVEQAVVMDGSAPVRLGFDPDVPGSVQMWMAVFGGGAIGEDGRPTLDREENAAALEWLKRVLDAQGGYAEVTSLKNAMDVFGDQNQYVTDQVAAQSWAQWYLNPLAATADAVSIAAVPVRDLTGSPVAVAGGTCFAIPVGAQNPDAAMAWALAVTSDEAWVAAGAARAETVAQKSGINTGIFTASPSADAAIREQFVTASGREDFDQAIGTYYEALSGARGLGSSPAGQQLSPALGDATAAIMSGEKTAQQALADAQTALMREIDG